MDVADAQTGAQLVKDEVGERCQKLFQDFLEEFEESGKVKYVPAALELNKPERNTLKVSFADLAVANQELSTTITEEYFRVYPFLCNG
ncbi:unnamed protein product, partial [Cyprideis torosa]